MKQLIVGIITIVLLYSCKEVYDAQYIEPQTGYLVVEGNINSGAGPTTIHLSRTSKIKSQVKVIDETTASVFVENDKNEKFPLYNAGAGNYTINSLSLTAAHTYRINITAGGKNYVSAFATVKTTPPIDSISWKRENDGLQLYVHAHDNTGNTKFYQWKYDETWEIHSSFVSNLKYINDGGRKLVGYRYPDQSYESSIVKCWQFFKQRNIQIGSTEMLNKDVVYLPITYIPPASEKLGVQYSIALKQYALTSEAYRFYLQMKKNTEQLGSIFDAQPSALKGNITCTTDAAEVVVGYVDITQEQEKRIFLKPADVGGWGYRMNCNSIEVENHPDSIAAKAAGMLPTSPTAYVGIFTIKKFLAASAECVDCTLRGSNVKPAYWPN